MIYNKLMSNLTLLGKDLPIENKLVQALTELPRSGSDVISK